MVNGARRLFPLLLVGVMVIVAAVRGRTQNVDADCVANAHQLVDAVNHYVRDHDQIFPPTNTQAAFYAAIRPYVSGDDVFLCPATHQPYVINAALSGVTMASIADKGKTRLLKDAAPHVQNDYTVAALNGYVVHGGVELTSGPDCATFLQSLLNSLFGYMGDHAETFPTMQNNAAFQQTLFPYAQDSRIFFCPETLLPYNLNSALSGVLLTSITDQGTTIVAQDSAAHADHLSSVLYLDGHVMRGNVAMPNNEVACVQSAQALATAIMEYAQDYDGLLPPMQNFQQFQTAVFPYIKSSWKFQCPATGLAYSLNTALSGVYTSTISDWGTMVLLQDASPHPADNNSTVVYMDGHAMRGGVAQPDPETACEASIKRLINGAILYALDHDNILPPMNNFQAFMTAIYPYVHSSWLFRCPATNNNYALNPSLSGVDLTTITDRQHTPVLRDNGPHPNKSRVFGYLDGHTERH
jgi:hypothetical protein